MKQNTPNIYAGMQIASRAGCLIGFIAIGSLLVGVVLDKLLNTEHLITFALVILSFPVSLFVVFRMTENLMKAVLPPSGESGFSKNVHKSDDDDDV